MEWNPWTPPGFHGLQVDSRWIPGGIREIFGWAACKRNSTWTPPGLMESRWSPVDSTWNLWGSVKSSPRPPEQRQGRGTIYCPRRSKHTRGNRINLLWETQTIYLKQ